MIGQLAMETGWSLRYILDKVNVVMLALMTADAPHYEEDAPRSPADLIRELEEREKQRKGKESSPQPGPGQGVDPMTYFNDYGQGKYVVIFSVKFLEPNPALDTD